MTRGTALTVAVLLALMPLQLNAQTVTAAYLCGSLSGVVIPAPSWKAEADAMSGQQVLLHFKGDGSRSEVKWFRDGRAYWEPVGLGLRMKTGFAIVAYTDDLVETYVFNTGTSELFFSQTRSGSAVLPNSVKAFRGTCRPAGGLVR